MSTPRRKTVVGNWKMNGLAASSAAFDHIASGAAERESAGVLAARMVVCPPATLLFGFAERAVDTPVEVGAQNCHAAPSGAHTGEIAAEMIKDAGGALVILGHSERRAAGETDAEIREKAEAARRAGLQAIICVGETLEEREAGMAVEIVAGQLAASLPDSADAAWALVAYEPVWAIGTGLTPSAGDVAEIHAAMRAALGARFGAPGDAMALLYGGSVSPANAAELLHVEGVDGALVGGASLVAEKFLQIVDAA